MWIITRQINDYNQDGEYFVCAFTTKPTIEELENMFPTLGEHLFYGGGRIDNEDEWWNLFQAHYGEKY